MKKVACEPMVGSDIEFFAKKEDDSIIPCVGLIPGTKEKPWSDKAWKPGYALQEDNVMVEVNIPPQTTPNGFVTAVTRVKSYAMKELSKRIDPVNRPFVDLARRVVHEFTPAQLDSPQAQLIGCDPDQDAYSGGDLRVPPSEIDNSRSCGGHIHLGGDFKCPDFVAALFTELGVAASCRPGIVDRSSRTQFYGQPGIFRSKSYGIEYRTPSNKWAHSEEDMWAMGSAAMSVANYLTNTDGGVLHEYFTGVEWEKLRDYIKNPSDHGFHEVRQMANAAGMPV